MRNKKEKNKDLDVIDLTSMEYPKSDIVTIEEVVLPDEAIVDNEVEETINLENNDKVEEEG